MQSSTLSDGFKGTVDTEVPELARSKPLIFLWVSQLTSSLIYSSFAVVFPNQLHDTWFWPLGAFLPTKHHLVVFVHWPLLWLVGIAGWDNASKLYQSTPGRQKMPHPSGSPHSGFAEFLASGGIGSSGWKEAAGPTSSSMQRQFQSQTSQAS